MKKGLMEVYDVTRLVDEFSGEEYGVNPFSGAEFWKTGLGCFVQ